MIRKPKFMNTFIVIILIVLLIIFIPKAFKEYNFSFKPKISTPVGEFIKDQLLIEPSVKHISFSEDNWNEEFYVYLVNDSNKTYYDINVTLDYPSFVKVSFMPEEQSAIMTLGTEKNNTSVGADFMILYGEDENGLLGGQTVINNIGPGEKKKIKVKITKEKSGGEDFDLNFKIHSYSNEPKPILGK